MKKLGIVRPEFVYRLFYPGVPAIVCSKSGRDISAMPANSCMPVSDRPSIIALAVRREIRTSRTIRQSGKFSVNWLNYKSPLQRKYVLDLVAPGDSEESGDFDKLYSNNIPYFLEKGVPLLQEAEANLVCHNLKILLCGDHDLFLAKVERGRASEDFLSTRYWEFRNYKPVLYLGSSFENPFATLAGRK